MKKHPGNILITGLPGVGKTTVIQKLCEMAKRLNPAGFYTHEIREVGIRKGFELVSLDGRRGLLAHTDIKGPARVSKYGVDVSGFEVFLDSLDLLQGSGNPIVIDEIGKMECHSEKFRSLIENLLASDRILVATIAARGGGFIADVKQRRDVTLLEVTVRNRHRIPGDILAMLQSETS